MTRYVHQTGLEADAIVQRCCERHGDLGQLTEHLIRDYPGIDPTIVTREVARAVAAVAWIGLKQDELLMSELIARVQLELSCGEREDAARLDPQPHPRRRRPPRAGEPQPLDAADNSGGGRLDLIRH